MSEAHRLDLGPVTEARFATAFATRAVVDKSEAATLIGVDPKTLEAMTEAKVVRSVPKGLKHRGYTERDLRAYLIEGPDIECAPAEPKPRPTPTGTVRHVNFSERRRGR